MSFINTEDPTTIFELLDKVGEGSYGSVYRAVDTRKNEIVAIKCINIEGSEDISDIQREVDILAKLDHPNIIKYRGSYYESTKEELWIVMQLCEGGAISDIMRTVGRCLTEPEVSYVVRETLKALDYLHGRKIIHRDIKANNILCDDAGNIVLTDFGVSAQLQSTLSKRQTGIGTPYWMSPESIREEAYDCRTDIWSLGITTIELLEGRPPLSDLHPLRAMWRIPNVDAPRLESNGTKVYSGEICDFVAACLQKDKNSRPQAKDLLSHPFLTMYVGKGRNGAQILTSGLLKERSNTVKTGDPAADSAKAVAAKQAEIAAMESRTVDDAYEMTTAVRTSEPAQKLNGDDDVEGDFSFQDKTVVKVDQKAKEPVIVTDAQNKKSSNDFFLGDGSQDGAGAEADDDDCDFNFDSCTTVAKSGTKTRVNGSCNIALALAKEKTIGELVAEETELLRMKEEIEERLRLINEAKMYK